MALQAGLFAGVIGQQKNVARATVAFVVSRLIAHILLGGLLGALGSVITLSLGVRLFFQGLVAAFMLVTAANLLELHPFFRYFALRPPKFLYKNIKKLSKLQEVFAPALLGAATIFVPCGVTQAMELLAINSADLVQGALIMGFFTAGTSVLFLVIGLSGQALVERMKERFNKMVAIFLIGMALYALNGILVVQNSPLTAQTITAPIRYFFSDERFSRGTFAPVINGKQQLYIQITSNGYTPAFMRVKKGIPVELILESKEAYSCAVAFVFKEFDINTFLKPTDLQTFTFTPQETGQFPFSCSMGMYTGVVEVVE